MDILKIIKLVVLKITLVAGCCLAQEQITLNSFEKLSQKLKVEEITVTQFVSAIKSKKNEFLNLDIDSFVSFMPTNKGYLKQLSENRAFLEIIDEHFMLAGKDFFHSEQMNLMPHEINQKNQQKLVYLELMSIWNKQNILNSLAKKIKESPYNKSLAETWGVQSFGGLGVDSALVIFLNGNEEVIKTLVKVFKKLDESQQIAILKAIYTNVAEIKEEQLIFLSYLKDSLNDPVKSKEYRKSIENLILKLSSKKAQKN